MNSQVCGVGYSRAMAPPLPTTLDWVKPLNDGTLAPAMGALKAPVVLQGRSLWGKEPLVPFQVWEHRFAERLMRAVKKRERAGSLAIASSENGLALSESGTVTARKQVGQGTYYFTDEHGHRSGRVVVTNADVATKVKWIKFGGNLFEVRPDGGFAVSLPVDAGSRIEVAHEIGAPATDPEVRVRMLLPGSEGEHSLQARFLDLLGGIEIPAEYREVLTSSDAPAFLEEMSARFLPREPVGWGISMDGGELVRELTVEPGNPQEVVVAVEVPSAPSRTSFALAIVEQREGGIEVLSSVIELESSGTGQVYISDGPDDGERSYDGARLLIRWLVESGVDDPEVELFDGIFRDDIKAVQAAVERGADPNVTIEEVVNRYLRD